MAYVILAVIAIVIIVAVVIFARKENAMLAEMVGALTQDQQARLEDAQVQMIPGKNEWTQIGMISRMTEKGDKFALKILWHNQVIQNATLGQMQFGDLTVSRAEKEAHDLKEGDFVKLYIAPEKNVGSFKILYD